VVREYERGILNKDEIQLKYSIGRHTWVLEWSYRKHLVS
jgi:hypothetical protein